MTRNVASALGFGAAIAAATIATAIISSAFATSTDGYTTIFVSSRIGPAVKAEAPSHLPKGGSSE